MESRRANEKEEEEERVDQGNWRERVEDLVAAGDAGAAISFLEALVTNLESQFDSSSSSSSGGGGGGGGGRKEVGLQLAFGLAELANLYSSQGFSLKSDDLISRSSVVRQRALACEPVSSRGSDVVKNESVQRNVASRGMNSDGNASPVDGHIEKSSRTTANNLPSQTPSDDDWEAIADRDPSELLSPDGLPEISKLSVEEPKVEGPKLSVLPSLIFNSCISAMKSVDFRSLLIFSAVFRVVLIIYGEWQDAHMEVRYTDVDYIVFSDAAALMVSGESPYKRTTYRYSPLLALLLIPNSIFHRSWGKFLFSASDLLVGLFIRTILKQRKVPEEISVYSVMVWLLNPFTFTIGTRGNCEPIVCAMILWIIICLMKGNLLQAAFWYGLVVHFRIYPIIYALPIILVLDPQIFRSDQKPLLQDWSASQGKTLAGNTKETFRFDRLTTLRNLFSREKITFALVSGGVYLACNAVSFHLYGWEFLHEALLYHLTRTDPRHNFSIYFYHIYLHYEHQFSVVEKLISFLPQFMVQLVLVFCFAQDLLFCLFLQTVAFVAFNKVITAQYFVWFYCLLPLILPWSRVRLKWEGLSCILLWIGAQIHWLFWGYLLEFKGINVFLQLWIASLLFLAVNTLVLVRIIQRHQFSPLFKRYESINPKNFTKFD